MGGEANKSKLTNAARPPEVTLWRGVLIRRACSVEVVLTPPEPLSSSTSVSAYAHIY